ncbi:hypothetical protein FO440_02095 [Mucilaginibacter corticis]|uniref:Uncharacterized protein n=1 Tax=Mucilaginibacter corticis TaxID=2597670 RepID=A0A556MSZ5_9SPHI|nr:hypothetical protein [Mucilaginibacter corticis]TSJ43005.1 hypothetical protein FO440_02095 [Mucilaginibacter corticis]
MFKFLIRITLCICLEFILVNSTFAQATTDSLADTKAAQVYANAENNFNKALGPQSRLYNGLAYLPYNNSIKGNPYFMDVTSASTGNIQYDGYTYKDVKLFYDLNKDQLITYLYNSQLMMYLIAQKVTSFDILDHHFIFIKPDASLSNQVKEGYYDALYDGKIKVLAKRTKTIQGESNLGQGGISSYFTNTATDYYLFKNNTYYKANSEGSFTSTLKDHAKEIKQFIKDKKIKYRKDKEGAMTAIATYYDHLNQ